MEKSNEAGKVDRILDVVAMIAELFEMNHVSCMEGLTAMEIMSALNLIENGKNYKGYLKEKKVLAGYIKAIWTILETKLAIAKELKTK